MSDTNIALMSLAALSKAIHKAEISPVELTQAYIDRIAKLDERLHAYNCVRTEAVLAEAKQAELAMARGESLGVLHGIPLGIKDLIDVAGVPTTAQAAHRRDHIATKDAGVVQALKKSGAVILGKHATAEYAVGGTQFDLPWPPPRNPWNLDYDACSSSSGTAVAVAAGLCAGGVGTETAGSIRAPAAWCGVAGLKPTDRLVSRTGLLPLSRSIDCIGPLAYTAEDCAFMLAGMISDDEADKAIGGFRVPDLSRLGQGIKGMRIGIVRHFYEDDENTDPEVLTAMNHSLEILRDLGAKLHTVQLADFDTYNLTAKTITWPEETAEHGEELRKYPKRFSAVTRSRLMDGASFTAPEYVSALRKRAMLTAELVDIMRDVDALVLPSMKKPAQILGYEHDANSMDSSLNRPFNLTGNPALSLCNGFTKTGLPLSIQIVGRHFEDDIVLQIGHALEKELGHNQVRPNIATTDD